MINTGILKAYLSCMLIVMEAIMKNKRQSEILKLLFSEQSLKTEYLSSYFGVSIETIRRDINELSRSGMIKKVYGGIRLNNDSMQMAALENWNERLTNFHEEKIKIATKALEFISDNSVIALDIGTTTYELSRLLSAKKDLSIITNSLYIASELSKNTPHKVYCIGGLVMPIEGITTGVFARNFLNNFASIDLFISSTDAITPQNGLSEFNENVIDVKGQLINRANRHITLIDHSKFGKVARFTACPLQNIDVLITDDQAPQEDIDLIRDLGVEVVVAD